MTISNCRSFQSHKRVRTVGLRCAWPTSFLLMLTNDSDYMSPHYFSPNNYTHLDNPRRSRPSLVVSNYLSPAIPSSPLLTFHPSHRLSVNFSQTEIPHLFPKSQRPKSNLSSTSYIRWPTAAAATGYSHYLLVAFPVNRLYLPRALVKVNYFFLFLIGAYPFKEPTGK